MYCWYISPNNLSRIYKGTVGNVKNKRGQFTMLGGCAKNPENFGLNYRH